MAVVTRILSNIRFLFLLLLLMPPLDSFGVSKRVVRDGICAIAPININERKVLGN